MSSLKCFRIQSIDWFDSGCLSICQSTEDFERISHGANFNPLTAFFRATCRERACSRLVVSEISVASGVHERARELTLRVGPPSRTWMLTHRG